MNTYGLLMSTFPTLNTAYNSIFRLNTLSIGLTIPIGNYAIDGVPNMDESLEHALYAEELGFSALWVRDIPFNVPNFGDVGQMYDPFTYLAFLAAKTSRIALGTGSIILPLRHPLHIAKSAASIDQLSGGRLIMGITSGDRPDEYPAHGIKYETRGELFRESYRYIQELNHHFPTLDSSYGSLEGDVDMLPKPTASRVPTLITGYAQQSQEWVATHTDGYLTYPRPIRTQQMIVDTYRRATAEFGLHTKPVAQSLYIDLTETSQSEPTAIHLGYRLNIKQLLKHLKELEQIGINHVLLNLRFNQMDTREALRQIAQHILPTFTHSST